MGRQGDIKADVSEQRTQFDAERTSIFVLAKQQVLCRVSWPFINSPSHIRQYTVFSAHWAN